MKELQVSLQGVTPGTFVPLTPGDSTYYTEMLSFCILKNIEALDTAGITLQRSEDSDLESFLSTLGTWGADMQVWILQALSARSEGSRALVPAVPVVGGIIAAGKYLLTNPSFWIAVLSKIIEIALNVWGRKLEHEQGSDFSDLTDVLRKALLDDDENSRLGNVDLTDLTEVLSQAFVQELSTGDKVSILNEVLHQFGVSIDATGKLINIGFGGVVTETP